MIHRVHIDGFGKFYDRSFEFHDGINVVYGSNESGKTTLKEFLSAMMFGLEKSRGIKARSDTYTVYRPAAGGIYGGTMELSVHGTSLMISRRFQSDDKETRIYEAQSGRQLEEPLFSMDKKTFSRTFCISGGDMHASKELAQDLTDYAANLQESASVNIQVSDALSYLKQKKSAFRKEWKEKDILKREKRTALDEIQGRDAQTGSWKKWPFALAALAAGMFLFFSLWALPVCAVFLGMLTYVWMEDQKSAQPDPLNERLTKEYQVLRNETDKLEFEIRQIDLAAQAIAACAKHTSQSWGTLLNDKVSQMTSIVTGGKYKEVKIDETLSFMVKWKDRFLDLKYLSTGTVEQIFLAVRLAAGELLFPEDTVPILADDIFGNFDEERMIHTVDGFSRLTNRQVILFTCKESMLHHLNKSNQVIHWIQL